MEKGTRKAQILGGRMMQNVSEHGIYPVSVPWVPVVFACQFGLGKDGEVLTSWCSVQLDQILVFFVFHSSALARATLHFKDNLNAFSCRGVFLVSVRRT